MFKMLFYFVLFTAFAMYGISKDWHKSIANFGEKAKPLANYSVNSLKNSVGVTKEVTQVVTEKVK